MRSNISCGIRIFMTQSDLLNVRYAAYSFNNASMFITNSCCITFGILTPFYTLFNTHVFTIDYNIVFTLVNTFVNTAVITGVSTFVYIFVLV